MARLRVQVALIDTYLSSISCVFMCRQLTSIAMRQSGNYLPASYACLAQNGMQYGSGFNTSQQWIVESFKRFRSMSWSAFSRSAVLQASKFKIIQRELRVCKYAISSTQYKNVLNPFRLTYCLIDDQIELWINMRVEVDLRAD